jgi:hypothetical protein
MANQPDRIKKSASKSASKPHQVRVKLSKKESVKIILDINRKYLIVNTSAMPLAVDFEWFVEVGLVRFRPSPPSSDRVANGW